MKKIYAILALSLLMLLVPVTKVQAGKSDKIAVALGADLTADQRKTVLDAMKLTEEDLAGCVVVTITNQMEHEYLDSYMESSVIGTKSLSSVMLKPGEEGSGVLVNTHNINYCTTGMYRNALLTAGLEDTEVTVVGPTSISGTAALIGAIKAYEAATGEKISDSVLDTAMNELITTGQIAKSGDADSEDVEKLIAYIKAKIASGDLKTDEDIRKAIEEGESKFGVTLTEDEIKQIIDVMHKIDKLGLDMGDLMDQAQDLYDKFGMDLVNNPDKAISYVIKNKVSSFFSGVSEKVKSFFSGWFSK